MLDVSYSFVEPQLGCKVIDMRMVRVIDLHYVVLSCLSVCCALLLVSVLWGELAVQSPLNLGNLFFSAV